MASSVSCKKGEPKRGFLRYIIAIVPIRGTLKIKAQIARSFACSTSFFSSISSWLSSSKILYPNSSTIFFKLLSETESSASTNIFELAKSTLTVKTPGCFLTRDSIFLAQETQSIPEILNIPFFIFFYRGQLIGIDLKCGLPFLFQLLSILNPMANLIFYLKHKF